MTEKRFKLIGDSNLEFLMQDILKLPIYDYDNNKKRLSLKNTLDLLNSLNDENEQLKSEKKDMQLLINTISDQRNEFHRAARENANRVGKLEKENEQLKQREKTLEGMIRTFDEGCKEIYDDKCRLEEENEELKQQLGKLAEFNQKAIW